MAFLSIPIIAIANYLYFAPSSEVRFGLSDYIITLIVGFIFLMPDYLIWMFVPEEKKSQNE